MTVFAWNSARRFFNHPTKKAFAESTYRVFVQTMHTVIHKDCGQFFSVRLPAASLVKLAGLLSSLLAALIDAV